MDISGTAPRTTIVGADVTAGLHTTCTVTLRLNSPPEKDSSNVRGAVAFPGSMAADPAVINPRGIHVDVAISF